MIRAGRTKGRKRRHAFGVDELQYGITVVEVAHHVLVAADKSSDRGHQPGGDVAASRRFKACVFRPAESGHIGSAFCQPGRRHVNGVNRGVIAFAGGVAPGKKTMARQYDTVSVRIFRAEPFEPETQLIARPLPRQPADTLAENLAGQVLGIRGRGDGNDRVRMHVIDMRARHIGVKRRVDRGRARVQLERAVGKIAHHLVLELYTPV